MWISSRRSQAVLLTLLAMGGLGFGVTLWCAAGPPLAAVSRDPVLPAGETPGGRIDKQPFSPIAIPLAGVKLIAWRPQGSGGEMELTLPWQTLPALFSWLARCGMNPRSFSLEREAQVLRLRLQLEAEDGT